MPFFIDSATDTRKNKKSSANYINHCSFSSDTIQGHDKMILCLSNIR